MFDADIGPDELPCDVKAVLDAACVTCHSSPVTSGAPTSLLTRYDFLAPSSVDDENMGRRALGRLDEVMPMPPLSEPPMTARQKQILRDWLADGMPAGSCGELPTAPAPTICTSNEFWPVADTVGSIDMQPGVSCRACHLMTADTYAFYFAGTVYPTFHEEDQCKAPPPGDARIELLDMDGVVTATLTPSANGNFSTSSVSPGLPLPYRARLVANGVAREMTTAQMSGDCNGCHTEQGSRLVPSEDLAPGRLTWPTPQIDR